MTCSLSRRRSGAGRRARGEIQELDLTSPLLSSTSPIPWLISRLSNGLLVAVEGPRDVPLCAVEVRYRVGARDEAEGESGLAHLVEHLSFYTPTGDAFQAHSLLRELGVVANATTSVDTTAFSLAGPSEALEAMLDTEARRMEELSASSPALDREREIIRQEARALAAAPYAAELPQLRRLLFAEGHPCQRSLLGEDTLQSLTLERAQDFHRFWYAPQNAIMVITGSPDPLEALKSVSHRFASIEKPSPPVVRRWSAGATGQGRLLGDSGESRAVFGFGLPGYLTEDQGLIETWLVAREEQQLFEELGLEGGAEMFRWSEGSMLIVWARLSSGGGAEMTERRLAEAIAADLPLDHANAMWRLARMGELDRAEVRAEAAGEALRHGVPLEKAFQLPTRWERSQAKRLRALLNPERAVRLVGRT